MRDKLKLPIKSSASYLGRGRPPRPHSTAPSSPKSCKEIVESYSNIDMIDAFHHQLDQDETKGIRKIVSVHDAPGNDAQLLGASSENFSHTEECKSQSIATAEDIYGHLQDAQLSCFCGTSVDYVSGTTSSCFAADGCRRDDSHGFREKNLEQDTDEIATKVLMLSSTKAGTKKKILPPFQNKSFFHFLYDSSSYLKKFYD
uniref:Uncharacterized protein n=1 Tax=Oryza brachyantha TaxID=4533 RepID=J3MKE4_ORYBR